MTVRIEGFDSDRRNALIDLMREDGIETRPGDVFEIRADAFVLPLRNTLARKEDIGTIRVRPL